MAIIFAALFIITFFIVIFLFTKTREWINVRKDLRTAKLCLLHCRNVRNLKRECTIGEQIELLPYDNTYEVERENIKLGIQLGAGAFGRVLLAEVKGLEGRPSASVAVKMCKYRGDKAHLHAFILELKIMTHLGKHLNIVNLIGAHTSNIVKGDLWILVEYCKHGNLLKFIQRVKAKFINQIDPATGDIDARKISLNSDEPLSRTSLRSSVGFWRASNFDHNECLETHPGGSSIGSKEQISSLNLSALTSGGEQHEMATKLPITDFKPNEESSVSNSAFESDNNTMLNMDMTTSEFTSPPVSPISSSTLGNIPGVSAPFTTTDIVCWAWQIANGMEYLTRRKVLHGDLAARNLLLADDNVVKICDFGLSREIYQNDVYVKESNDIMPVKWMSPEAIQQKVFSIQSDVWAYGITLWEMFTLGDTPYPGMPINQEFANALEKGMRMEKPRYCNDEIYGLLLHCWKLNPIERPSFGRILDLLSDMLSQERKQHYVNMNVVYKQKNEEWLSHNEDYTKMVISPDFKNVHEHRQHQPAYQNINLGNQMKDVEPMVSYLVNSTDNNQESKVDYANI